MPSASDVLNAFRNGHIDCASLTLDESYLLLEEGYDIKILFIMDISHGADVILAKPEITSITDLKGKKIAVEHMAVGAYLLERALENSDISIQDLTIVPTEVSGHEKAYLSGEADAVVTFEPTRTRLLSKGAVQLFDSKQIPNEIFDVFIIRSELLESKPQLLKKTVNIWYKSLEHFRPGSKTMFQFTGKRLNLSPSQLSEALRGIKFPGKKENASILSDNFKEPAEMISKLMLTNSLLKEEVYPENLLIRP